MDHVPGSTLRVFDAASAIIHWPQFADSRIVVLEPAQTIIELPSGRIVRVLEMPNSDVALRHLIDHALSHNGSHGTELVLVGGGHDAQRSIADAVPKLRMNAFYVHHLTNSGSLFTLPEGRGHLLGVALGQVKPISHRGEQALFERATFDQSRAHDEHKERLSFFAQLKDRKSPVTLGLLAAIAAMFLLQLSFAPDVTGALGLTSSTPRAQQYWLILSIAMGALWTPSVLDGEVWRAISVGFLHFNLMHIAANSFVLYMLGAQLEKVLGSARFLIIYTVALLGGSLASTFLTEGVAVGASGAIWGLLGAQVALAYGRPPVLPSSVARAMKPLAMRNLLLNVGISFIGGIDWAAHFGGGLFGGALLATGWLYPDHTRGSSAREQGPPIVLVARACAVLLVVGVLAALYVGQPWRLASELSL